LTTEGILLNRWFRGSARMGERESDTGWFLTAKNRQANGNLARGGEGRRCGRKMSWQKYGFPSGLRWVWINFRMAVTASPAGPYNPRWFGRALGRRNSPRAIARHTRPPEPVVMGEQPRWGEQLETVINATEFRIHGATPFRLEMHQRLDLYRRGQPFRQDSRTGSRRAPRGSSLGQCPACTNSSGMGMMPPGT